MPHFRSKLTGSPFIASLLFEIVEGLMFRNSGGGGLFTHVQCEGSCLEINIFISEKNLSNFGHYTNARRYRNRATCSDLNRDQACLRPCEDPPHGNKKHWALCCGIGMNKILNNDRQQVHGRMEHHSEQLKIVDGTMQYPFNIIRKNVCVCVVWILAVWQRRRIWCIWTFLHKSELTLQKCSHVQEQSADCWW